MNWTIIATCVAASATVIIAIFAGVSLWLALKIKRIDDEYRQQISDLFQAITISNLLHGLEEAPAFSTIENKIREFSNIYKGSTPIFG